MLDSSEYYPVSEIEVWEVTGAQPISISKRTRERLNKIQNKDYQNV